MPRHFVAGPDLPGCTHFGMIRKMKLQPAGFSKRSEHSVALKPDGI
jgi:hypothetical protein